MAVNGFYPDYRLTATGSRNESAEMTDSTNFRVADLDPHHPTPFDLRPGEDIRAALAAELGLLGLRKLSFTGTIAAQGRRDWVLSGKLGATVVQPCVVTLEPVTTRIDTEVMRTYVAGLAEPEALEVEMPEDDSVERLGATIDPASVMAEELALALPPYPRKDGVELGESVFAEPGTKPMPDDDAKPFAGLSGLRDTLKKQS